VRLKKKNKKECEPVKESCLAKFRFACSFSENAVACVFLLRTASNIFLLLCLKTWIIFHLFIVAGLNIFEFPPCKSSFKFKSKCNHL